MQREVRTYTAAGCRALDETDPVIIERVRQYFGGRNGMLGLGSEGDYSAAFDLVMPDEAARKRYLEQLFEGADPLAPFARG